MPVLIFGQNKFGVKYADTITEAGLVGLLSKKNIDQNLLNSIKNKILISLKRHHSKGIVIHGHQECAGNPVDGETHKKDIIKSVKIIELLISNNVRVFAVFVKRRNAGWVVEEL